MFDGCMLNEWHTNNDKWRHVCVYMWCVIMNHDDSLMCCLLSLITFLCKKKLNTSKKWQRAMESLDNHDGRLQSLLTLICSCQTCWLFCCILIEFILIYFVFLFHFCIRPFRVSGIEFCIFHFKRWCSTRCDTCLQPGNHYIMWMRFDWHAEKSNEIKQCVY